MIDDKPFRVGKGEWDAEKSGPWVSKTDVTQFLRCPYRVALNYQERIPYGEFLKPELRNFFFTGGIEFETQVAEEAAEGKEVIPVTAIEEIPSQDALVRVLSPIRNHELGITGFPDFLVVENGKVMPVEVKNHSDVTWLDRVELAFYWRLLEPLQVEWNGRERKGYVVPNSGEWVEVALNDYDISELSQYISEVRLTKLEGTQPSLVRECDSCVLKDEHLPLIFRAHDTSLIIGIKRRRRRYLEELGIRNIEQLAEVDAERLLDQWWRSGNRAPGLTELRMMQAHAIALLTGQPQIVHQCSLPETGKALILDLEYSPGSVIFVSGVLVVEDGKEVALHQGFARSIDDEGALLTSLADLLNGYPNYDIVTWNGLAADFPALSVAWAIWRLPKKPFREIQQRHIDLYSLVRASIRLPTLKLRLKEVSAYFGFERSHADISSMEIPVKYQDFLSTGEPDLEQEILDHNADDLRSLLVAWAGLREISERGNRGERSETDT